MQHSWNHQNYAVPPERLKLVEEAIDLLFAWDKFVAKPHLLGYRLTDDMHEGAIYFRPSAAARALEEALDRLRAGDGDLAAALVACDELDADYADHSGILVSGPAEWENLLARAERLERERPDLQIRVVDVLRPGDGRAPTDFLYQAFLRIGLLTPPRNTFEIQARKG